MVTQGLRMGVTWMIKQGEPLVAAPARTSSEFFTGEDSGGEEHIVCRPFLLLGTGGGV
jgi:hypothetical protein